MGDLEVMHPRSPSEVFLCGGFARGPGSLSLSFSWRRPLLPVVNRAALGLLIGHPAIRTPNLFPATRKPESQPTPDQEHEKCRGGEGLPEFDIVHRTDTSVEEVRSPALFVGLWRRWGCMALVACLRIP